MIPSEPVELPRSERLLWWIAMQLARLAPRMILLAFTARAWNIATSRSDDVWYENITLDELFKRMKSNT